jgi:hypothetical protein
MTLIRLGTKVGIALCDLLNVKMQKNAGKP